MRQVLFILVSPMRKWGSEMLIDMLKVTQLRYDSVPHLLDPVLCAVS